MIFQHSINSFQIMEKITIKFGAREGFSMHHKLYKNINMPMNFVAFMMKIIIIKFGVICGGWWKGTSKRTGETDTPNPVNVSFKWVDGKIVSASWITNTIE